MTLKPAALSQADAASSLLSLSFAAASASPIPTPDQPHSGTVVAPSNGLLSSSVNTSTSPRPSPTVSTSLGSTTRHRRLASTGKARRRLSDARDAASRPSPALLQSSTAALSLASLSLSSSPPAAGPLTNASTSFVGASNSLNGALPGSMPHVGGQPASLPLSDGSNFPSSAPLKPENHKSFEAAAPIAIGHGKNGGRKRGIDHKCESCAKIYRHPSCLIKHRWEHTPHWREASKFVLSKHQQVQLLEAAAILSHLSPSATSLPEDRSLWPSFLSGGSLPKVEPVIGGDNGSPSSFNGNLISCSVPATSGAVAGVGVNSFSRATSSGPRLHDYSIPTSSTGTGGITQLRPGLLGVSTGTGSTTSGTDATATVREESSTGSKPVPVPASINNDEMDPFTAYIYQHHHHHHHHHHDGAPDSWTSSPPFGSSHDTPSSFVSTELSSGVGMGGGGGSGGGWSLPRSSLRSVSESAFSQSRSSSGSRSRSDEDDDSVGIDIDVDGAAASAAVAGGGTNALDTEHSSKYAGRYGRKLAFGDDDEMEGGFSVREEDEDDAGASDDGDLVGVKSASAKLKHQETEWDGLEMDMDMD